MKENNSLSCHTLRLSGFLSRGSNDMRVLPLFVFCICLLLFSSCGTSKKTSNSVIQGNAPVKFNTEAFDDQFFQAETEKLKGNNEKAIEYFKAALVINPNSDAAAYEIGTIYFNSGKLKDAETYIQKAVYLKPNNKWYRILLADIFQNQKKWPQAIECYETLIAKFPDERDYYTDLASVYIFQNKANDAIKTYERIEKHFGPETDVIQQKYKIYYAIGKYDKAIEEIQPLLKKDPDNIQYLELLAEAYGKSGNDKKALEIFEKLEASHPEDATVQMQVAEFYIRKGDKVKYIAALKKAFANPAMSIDSKVGIIYTGYLQQKTIDTASLKDMEELSAIIAKAHPEEAKAHALYADVLNIGNKMKEAREEYRKSIKLKSDLFATWIQLLRLDAVLRDNVALEDESQKAIERFPNQPDAFYFNGLAKNELKKYKEAIDVVSSGLALIGDDERSKGMELELYITRAESYYRLKEFEKSDKDFDRVLLIDPNNTLALNNYAYYLSVRNEKLEKAAEMSKKTLVLEPGSASYQDTYGWILFKLGNFTEAEQWIKKATLQDHSAEVSEHYGDVLYKLGRVDEAVQYWEKAKKAGSENPNIDKKISEKKIID